MALTISNQGSAKSGTSTATLAITSNTAAVGDYLLVVVAADNAGTNGVSSVTTCADAGGVNVYTKRGEITVDPGAASAGATLAFFTAPITSALSAATITVSFSPNTTRKLAHVYRIQPGASEVVNYNTVGAGATGTSTTPTITATSVTNGYTIFGAMAAETDDAITTDSDTTNGNWSTAFTDLQDDGADASTMRIHSQWKTVSATANQTYNLGIAGAQDWAINWIQFYPTADTTDDLTANDVESLTELTKPVIGQKHNLTANDVESNTELTKPVLVSAGEDVLLAENVESNTELTKPVIGQKHNLTANDVESTSEVSIPTATIKLNLHPRGVSLYGSSVYGENRYGETFGSIESVTELTKPVVVAVGTNTLLAENVESNTELTQPTLTQVHSLTANDVESNTELTKPVITQVHVITANDVESNSEVTKPVINQVHIITANDVESVSEVSAPVFVENVGGTDNLFADNVESSTELTKPVITQVHTLSAGDVESLTELTTPNFSQVHILLGDDVASLSEVTTPTLAQIHNILSSSVESLTELTKPNLASLQALLALGVESLPELSIPTLRDYAPLYEDTTDGNTTDSVLRTYSSGSGGSIRSTSSGSSTGLREYTSDSTPGTLKENTTGTSSQALRGYTP